MNTAMRMKLALVLTWLLYGVGVQADEAPLIELARDGVARMPIVMGAQAGDAVRATAEDLADMLQRISGARFDVLTGDGSRGIVIGLPGDFTALGVEQTFGDHPFERDHYRMTSTPDALYLLGASPNAVAFAVSDLLHQFGYRHFFPSLTWEIVPRQEHLTIAVDRQEQPAYYSRNAPRGGIRLSRRPWAWPEPWTRWAQRNRITQSFELHTGHSYLGLIERNRQAFDANPEFYARVDGQRRHIGDNTKLCIGNPRLRELVVEDAIRRIRTNPDLDSISLDPSDGGSWCDCPACNQLGSISDRVVVLVNQVAQALEREFDRTYYIGIYAYNDYSLPPNIDVHPNVIVSLATAFIRGDQTFEQMLEGWSKRTKLIGIREYYGLTVWNSSMPGEARVARQGYLASTITLHHARGARFVNAESCENWGPNGLGYYLATRLLWDLRDAERVDELIQDFLDKSFGPAAEPMGRFYDLITSRPLLSEHLVGSMYRCVAEARAMTDDLDILARLDDLAIYCRHVDLHRRYNDAQGADRQGAFDELLTFIWRTRTRMVTDSLGLISYMNRLQRNDEHVTWGPGRTNITPSDRHRINEDVPLTRSEIDAMVERGVAEHRVLDFEPRSFSRHLSPARGLNLPADEPLNRATQTRGRAENYTWITRAPMRIVLPVRTGLIYTNRGPARMRLEVWDDDMAEFDLVAEAEVEPDRQTHRVELMARQAGLHRIVWDDRRNGTEVDWPGQLPRATPMGVDHVNHHVGRDNWYFYVPRGTETISLYVDSRAGALHDARGNEVLRFGDVGRNYVTIPVPTGHDGRLWSVRSLSDQVQLLTTPPFVVSRPQDLLLPRDLLEQETSRR